MFKISLQTAETSEILSEAGVKYQSGKIILFSSNFQDV